MEWISVKERLPRNGAKILVCHLCKIGESMEPFVAASLYNEGSFERDFKVKLEDGLLSVSMNDVTHWMPLPEPPK